MYYFLQIQALRRWTLMYVIRFSKINIAQVSSVTFENSILIPLCQEKKIQDRQQDKTDTTLPYQPQLAAPFNSPCLSRAMRSK